MKKKPPYNNSVSDFFIVVILISLLIALGSCANVKKDCRGIKHYKHPNGFYI